MADLGTVVGLVSAATALVASVAGPLVALHVDRTQVRAAVLSANRQRWIDAFRELVAEFCAQVATAVQMRASLFKDGRIHVSVKTDSMRQFERLVMTFAKIRLMTDPEDERHRELVEVIEGLLVMLRSTPSSEDVQPAAEAAGGASSRSATLFCGGNGSTFNMGSSP